MMEDELNEFIDLYSNDLIDGDDLNSAFEFYLEATADRNSPRSTRSRFGEFHLESMDEEDFVLNFRFTREQLHDLNRCLQMPSELVIMKDDGSIGHRLSGMTALCITLRRLAYPNRLSDLCPMFGYSRGALSKIIQKVIFDINQRKGHLLENLGSLQWLNQNRLEVYAEAIARCGAPHNSCWGFIDGTARQICRPSTNQHLYYSGHKRYHCVKYQSVMAPDGIVVSLQGPYQGRRHDAGIWRQSGMTEQLRRLCSTPNRTFVLYGDPAYPISNLLITPYPTTSTQQHALMFNRSMASVTQTVERGFSKTVREFAFVDFARNQKLLLQDVAGQYKLATLLSNCHTCLNGSQVSIYFNVDPPTLEEYLGAA